MTSVTTSDISQQFLTLIVNAFSIVAALAWSDALNGFFARAKVFKTMPTLGPFVYAAVITLLAYFVGVSLSQYVKQPCTTLCTQKTTEEPTHTPTQTPAAGRF